MSPHARAHSGDETSPWRPTSSGSSTTAAAGRSGAGGPIPCWSTSSSAFRPAPRWTSAPAKAATRSGSPSGTGTSRPSTCPPQDRADDLEAERRRRVSDNHVARAQVDNVERRQQELDRREQELDARVTELDRPPIPATPEGARAGDGGAQEPRRSGASSSCRWSCTTPFVPIARLRGRSAWRPGRSGRTTGSCSRRSTVGPSTRDGTGVSGRSCCTPPGCGTPGSTTPATRPRRCS
jgi:hypothetical protein